MRILIVCQYFWPENFRINDLARGLRENGHTLTVLTGVPNYPTGRIFPGYDAYKIRREDYHGIEVIRVPLVPRARGGAFRLALNYLSFALSASLLGPMLCRGEYGCIFVFQLSPATMAIPALVLKVVKGAPLILWVQDLWPDSLVATGYVQSRLLLLMVEKLVRLIYRGCDRILMQSKAFSSSVVSLGGDSSKMFYFPNSAEQLYQPVSVDADAPEQALMPAGFRVMFAGNIGAGQDFDSILSAAERLRDEPDIHWVILGDGSARLWVEAQIRVRRLSQTVHLLGRHPMGDMPKFFALADVLLVPLKREPIFALTIPSKLQSYLACAKPVIAALDGEGARIVLEAGAGLACPAESPNALAESVLAMRRLSQSDRQAMGQRGRDYFLRNFERTLLLNQLERWMEETSTSARRRD